MLKSTRVDFVVQPAVVNPLKSNWARTSEEISSRVDLRAHEQPSRAVERTATLGRAILHPAPQCRTDGERRSDLALQTGRSPRIRGRPLSVAQYLLEPVGEGATFGRAMNHRKPECRFVPSSNVVAPA